MSFAIKHSTDIDDIIDVSWRQSRSKTEVCIFEIGNMNDLIPRQDADQIRQALKDNKIKIRQISNYKWLPEFSKVKDYSKQIAAKFVDSEIFKVSSEIVIFDSTVAIYRTSPSVSYLEINDANYAKMMRDLFDNIWRLTDTLILGMGEGAEAKQYVPISTKLKVGKRSIPAIIYPAKDDGQIEKAFNRKTPKVIETYLQECALKFNTEFSSADLVIAYAWNDGKARIIDPWFLTRNKISNDSGFLYDAMTIKEGEIVKDMGVASGNSNIVMAVEELLLRELVLEKGLSLSEASDRTKYFPKFPAGMKPEEEFYQK